MAFNFCPHCGEDVAAIHGATGGEPAASAPAEKGLEVIRREVVSTEKDRLWGLLQLPTRLIAIGVLVDSSQTPVALVLEDPDKRLWAGAAGEVKMLGDLAMPSMPAPPPENGAKPATVPSHLCNSGAAVKEERGAARYGSRE